MSAVVAEHELFQSCRVLFGSDMLISRAFLEYLQPSGIKIAYRKKAFETHPDMLPGKGSQQKSAALFQMVQQAYETLTGYLDAREKGFKLPPQQHPAKASTARPKPKPATARPAARRWTNHHNSRTTDRTHSDKTSAHSFYSWHHSTKRTAQQQPHTFSGYQRIDPSRSASIPARRLLFGHYLYYAGITNWQTIIKALVWQRTRRPRLGELGRQFGWLSSQDILHILRNRALSDSFGKSAVEMKLLTPTQLRVLVFRQKRLQKKFGEYFTQNKILTPYQLTKLINQFYTHNSSMTSRRAV